MSFICAVDIDLPRENIAVALTPSPFGSHVGILFHTAKEGMHVLHLQFHMDLIAEPFPQPTKTCWIASKADVPPIASKALVGVVRALSKRLPKIKYGINFLAAQGSIDSNGNYKAPKGSDGLTCATFVLEVFRAASLRLIKEDTWTSTEANVAWGHKVCKALEINEVDPAHIEHVRSNIVGLRIRPEEVAAASQNAPKERPIDFNVAEIQAAQIKIKLDATCVEKKDNILAMNAQRRA